jgi:hypothetical protein
MANEERRPEVRTVNSESTIEANIGLIDGVATPLVSRRIWLPPWKHRSKNKEKKHPPDPANKIW